MVLGHILGLVVDAGSQTRPVQLVDDRVAVNPGVRLIVDDILLHEHIDCAIVVENHTLDGAALLCGELGHSSVGLGLDGRDCPLVNLSKLLSLFLLAP